MTSKHTNLKQAKDEKTSNLLFFKWLFESDNINLIFENETAPFRENSVIYYPEQLKDFFVSEPMQRLKKILQLSKVVDINSNALHTRYEHSIGVYNLKKDIIMNLFLNDLQFKSYVEEHNLKNNLIAELIKSAGHDIGHLPLSHVLELSVIKKVGFHEEIGKRILLENEQIRNCLLNISPDFPKILKDTLENDYFGFKFLDEGNYDIDRFDYLYRDLAYLGTPLSESFAPLKMKMAECDSKVPKLDNSGRIILASENSNNKMFIPVFSISSLPDIERFLNTRVELYKNCYSHPVDEILAQSVGITINKAIENHEPNGIKVQKFLIDLKNISSANNVNLDEWLSWNDLTFYNELLDIGEFTQNPALRKIAIIALPGLEQLFDISSKMLGLKNRTQPLSKNDKIFLKRLHRYLNEKTNFTQDLSDPNYLYKYTAYTSDQQKINILKSVPTLPINFNSRKIKPYKSSEPIFIETETGEIYTYDAIPGRPPKINLDNVSLDVAICFTPLLESQHNALIDLLDEKSSPTFGRHYFNRPSPAGTYIENSYDMNNIDNLER